MGVDPPPRGPDAVPQGHDQRTPGAILHRGDYPREDFFAVPAGGTVQHAGVGGVAQRARRGQEGLDPALLRFAKGGAPTLSDLAARLSARAGELRDSMKTKSDLTWKDSLKDEIAKLVKVKPTNSENIKGMEGVLLRAEEAITKGNLEKAIREIDTLEINARGVLDAWLKEAKAKKDASVAAENILAKTTAALKIKN